MIFKPYHIPMIRSGSKTATRREWKESYAGPTVGSIQMAAAKQMVPDAADHNSPMLLTDDDCDCYIRITDRYRQPLGEMTDVDAQKEGDYDDLDEFRDGYERVYGDGSWNPEKVVTVVEFEYVGGERPTEQTTLKQ